MTWSMQDILSVVTIITLLAYIVGDKAIGFLKTRGIDLGDISEIRDAVAGCEKCHKNVKELHDWHNVTDEDGIRRWYSRPSLERAIVALSENSTEQTILLKEIINQQELQREEHKLILSAFSKLLREA